jgi:hypothetical protein
VLHYPEAAHIVFGIGILIIATYLIGDEIMKLQKMFNNLDEGSKDITEALSAVNDPEYQLNSRDLLNVFKKNLEMLRDHYLQLTEAEFYFEVSEALEPTKHRLKSADPLHVDWMSRDALLIDDEVNLKQ